MEKINTPLMNQYYKIKSLYPQEILFFRMGDFYEMFGDDAKVASKILGIALTSRAHGKSERVPLAGVPYHSAEKYISQLLRAGKKVVICEQIEDPKTAKGIVKREVVELITPGTITIDSLFDSDEKIFLASLTFDEQNAGLAVLDLSTGEFKVEEDSFQKVVEKINAIKPKEILLPQGLSEKKSLELEDLKNQATLTFLDDYKFSYDYAYQTITNHFKTASLDGFGISDLNLGISSAGSILSYLEQTKKTFLLHINKITKASYDECMFLDFTTLRNLEIFSPFSSTDSKDFSFKKNSLFHILNKTKTAMGARLLKEWLKAPLYNVEKIKQRQHSVSELLEKRDKTFDLTKLLDKIQDIERLAGKLGYGKANPKDLVALGLSLKNVPEIKNLLKEFNSTLLKNIKEKLPDTSEIVDLIQSSIVDDPPSVLTEGGIIKKGYSQKLDELKEKIKTSRDWIATLQQTEREKTKIPILKVGFNRVFGYYIEITKRHLSKVPQGYIRKQTLINAERFVTEELKKREEIILGAEEKIFELEHDLFLEIRSKVAKKIKDIQKTSEYLATLDILLSFKEVALNYRYVRPEIDESDDIIIEDGRHPILEHLLEKGFVPNDTIINSDEKIHIITGPNMAGKSTYLRQVGLIVLLAQVGCFVPAKKAKIGLVDRIFTRVGALDSIATGKSTFLVEMNETANILNNATSKSLILLDEIGKGTSTFDGLSIAWATTEYIHYHPKLCSRTLVATHFHELTELAKLLPKVKNYQIKVKEWKDEIIFLRKIVPGGCDDSFGIYVAKLAGVPKEVLERSREILLKLEGEELSYKRVSKPGAFSQKKSYQLSIFSAKDNELAQDLKKIDINKLTPLEALNKLEELKKKAQE